MTQKQITCILCPLGCRVTAELEGNTVTSVSGNTCKRGERYAQQECTAPVRMLTALVRVQDREIPLSVKTSAPIPKELLGECAQRLRGIIAQAPVHPGDVIYPSILNTNADIIATNGVE